jgi:prepilin-type N-terminal cleavage/methylation domain-containing protein
MRYRYPLRNLGQFLGRAMSRRLRFGHKPSSPSVQLIRFGQRRKRGFTLPEVIVTMIIASLIMALAFGAFFSISQMINRMELESERRVDLSRAFDFLTAEIRSAQRVNTSETGGTLSNIIASAGLSSLVGGTPVLYLEVPFSTPPTTSCPAEGLNYDRVVYDIRTNPNHWLGPRVISRYGRTPTPEGAIDPCDDPIPNDVLVDNMSDNPPNPLPACDPAKRTGAGGFYACVNDGLVTLALKSKVVDLKTQDIDSKALSRPGFYSLKPVLSGSPSSGQMTLNWTWASTTPGVSFKVYRQDGTDRRELPDSNSTDLQANDPSPKAGVQNCYTVVATLGAYSSEESNRVCHGF